LTHRSFVLARDERAFHHVATSRKVGAKRLELVGANDHLAKQRIACIPEPEDCKNAVAQLARRLNIDTAHATAIYARGGANATPLALPELLDVLVRRLARADAVTATGKNTHDRIATDHRR
jgi:hypothetical protein